MSSPEQAPLSNQEKSKLVDNEKLEPSPDEVHATKVRGDSSKEEVLGKAVEALVEADKVAREKWEAQLEQRHRAELIKISAEVEAAEKEADKEIKAKIELLEASSGYGTDLVKGYHEKINKRTALLKQWFLFGRDKKVEKAHEEADKILEEIRAIRLDFEKVVKRKSPAGLRLQKAIDSSWKSEPVEVDVYSESGKMEKKMVTFTYEGGGGVELHANSNWRPATSYYHGDRKLEMAGLETVLNKRTSVIERSMKLLEKKLEELVQEKLPEVSAYSN